jgi:serine/threonine protein phosphatase 1
LKIKQNKQEKEQLDILVVGDVHGCLHTFKDLLEQHWTNNEILIQLGDLIDRGKYSGETIQFIQNLQKLYPNNVFILRGNHEQELIEYAETGSNKNWIQHGGSKTLKNLMNLGLSLSDTAAWMEKLPLFWENDCIFVSHAGVSQNIDNPLDAENPDGVLWTRQSLKNLGKVQIVGHTPTISGKIEYDDRSNSWYIDTGACFSRHLSAIKLTPQGEVINTYSCKTCWQDLEKRSN